LKINCLSQKKMAVKNYQVKKFTCPFFTSEAAPETLQGFILRLNFPATNPPPFANRRLKIMRVFLD